MEKYHRSTLTKPEPRGVSLALQTLALLSELLLLAALRELSQFFWTVRTLPAPSTNHHVRCIVRCGLILDSSCSL